MPDHWDDTPDATFTTMGGICLEAVAVGEVVYAGTQLDDLQIRGDGVTANYVLAAQFVATEDVIFEIRGRRTDSSHFVGLTVDLESNTLTLRRVNGTVKEIQEFSHPLTTDETVIYRAELWMFNSRLLAFINDKLVIDLVSEGFETVHGFSIDVPSMPTTTAPTWSEFSVRELVEPSPQSVLDPADLNLQFRIQMKEEIENPAVKNWTTFKRARKLWDNYRNAGYRNEKWADLGYPIREPVSEEWFTTSTEDPYS